MFALWIRPPDPEGHNPVLRARFTRWSVWLGVGPVDLGASRPGAELGSGSTLETALEAAKAHHAWPGPT